MRRTARLAFSIALSMLFGQTAYGQFVAPPAPSEPVTAIPGVEFQITPRFWYSWETTENLPSLTPFAVTQTTNFEFLLASAAVSARFLQLPDTTFIFSGLYGTSTEENNVILLSPSLATVVTQKIDIARLGPELLAQTAIPNTNFGWIVGGRSERGVVSFFSNVQESTVPAGIVLTFSSVLKGSVNAWTGKVGLAAAVPLTPSGDLRFFANGLIFGGLSFASKEFGSAVCGGLGPDMSVGLQYRLSPSVT
jgi:hypothetical protein